MEPQLKAFETLFRKLQPSLVRFAFFQVMSMDDAHEVVQDVFINVWKHKEKLVLDDSLKAYLFRSIRNTSINRLKQRRLDMQEIDERVMGLPDNDGSEEAIRAERLQAIFKQVNQLPESCKEIFLMSRMEGLSHKEIAEILEISPKTVENQVGIALKKIRHGIFGHE